MKSAEGYVDFRGFRTWYRIVGDGDGIPLLCLHGGPGVPHDYLEPLEAVAETGRPVVFYDQLGCGQSDHPDDTSLWTLPTFLDELATVRRELALDRVHLLGQSWGGFLALEHALSRPGGLVSLILASTASSVAAFAAEAERLKAGLPADVQETIDRHEAAGTTDDAEYMQAALVFYALHVCRVQPWPECVMRAFLGLSQPVYGTMWGPSEFTCTGNLKDWDVTDRLGEIDVPTLITSGRYDEATPMLQETLNKGIAGSEWVVFEDSAHVAHAEEVDRYREVLVDFLDRVEA